MKIPKDSALIIALLLALFAIAPLLTHAGLPNTADGPAHLMRQVELNEAWKAGIFYPRWAPNLALGHGMPLFNYAPPLLYHTTQILHLTTLPLDAAMKGSVILAMLLYSVGMYLFVRDLFGPKAGLLAAAVYLYAPYRLREAFIQGNYGQFWGLAFYPLILWTFQRLVMSNRWRHLPLAALSLAGLLLSHNISSMIFAPLFGAYLLFILADLRFWIYDLRLKKPFVNRKSKIVNRLIESPLPKVILAIILGLGVSAFFWLPAFGEKDLIRLSGITSGFFDFRHNFISLAELLALPRPLDLSAINPYFPLSLGIAQVALALLAILSVALASVTRKVRGTFFISYILFFGAIFFFYAFMILPQSQWVWEAIPLVALTEFPWRMSGPAILAAAVLAGIGLRLLERWGTKAGWWGLAIGLVFTIGVNLVYLTPDQFIQWGTPAPADAFAYEVTSGAIGTTSTGEFLPRWADRYPSPETLGPDYAAGHLPAKIAIVTADGRPPTAVSHQTLEYTARKTLIAVNAPAAFTADFLTLYWPFWRVVLLQDGQAIKEYAQSEIEITQPDGLLRVNLPAGNYQISLLRAATPIRRAATAMSVVSLMALVGLVGARLFRRVAFLPPLIPPSGGETLALPPAGETLTLPSAGETLTLPSAGETLALPSAGETLALPTAGETLALPTAGETLALPSAGETLALPPAGETLTLPPAGETLALPSAGETLALPPAGETLALPSAGETLALPPAGETLALPPAGGTLTLPSAGETLTLPSAGETLALPPAGETLSLPPAGETLALPPAGETLALPPAGETLALPSAGETLALPPAGETLALPPAGGTLTLPSAEETLALPPAGGTLTLPSAGETLALPPAGETLALPSAGETLAPPSAGETLALPSAGETLPPPSAEETLALPPAGETLTLPPAGETLTLPSAGETLALPPAGETLALPPAGETLSPPSAGETLALPPAGETLALPSAGETLALPPAGETLALPPAGGVGGGRNATPSQRSAVSGTQKRGADSRRPYFVLGAAIIFSAIVVQLVAPLFRVQSPPDTVYGVQQALEVDFADQTCHFGKLSTQLERGRKIRLLGVDLPLKIVSPGDEITVVPYWRALQALDTDYAVFLHLDAPDGQTIAAADQSHPSDIPTANWPPSLYVRNPIKLTVPADALPIRYSLRVGLYSNKQGRERLPLSNGSGDAFEVGQVWVKAVSPPKAPDGPTAHFDDTIHLLGTKYDPAAQTITLYWQADAPILQNYSIFLHLLDNDGHLIGQNDGVPYQNLYPTSAWRPDQVIEDARSIAEAAGGEQISQFAVGIYDPITGERLHVVDEKRNSLPDNALMVELDSLR